MWASQSSESCLKKDAKKHGVPLVTVAHIMGEEQNTLRLIRKYYQVVYFKTYED